MGKITKLLAVAVPLAAAAAYAGTRQAPSRTRRRKSSRRPSSRSRAVSRPHASKRR